MALHYQAQQKPLHSISGQFRGYQQQPNQDSNQQEAQTTKHQTTKQPQSDSKAL